jgi:D-glycero-beta-D-manno-heptose 1-phosphate adenylyltransferase
VSRALTQAEAARRSAEWRAAGKTVVLANGVFDLLHVGHLRYLEDARARGDALLVAVNADVSARALKGEGRPVVPEAERVELVAALACVDGAFLFSDKDVVAVLRALRPHVHAKGTDYTPETVPERAIIAEWGGQVAITGDAKNHSSTEQLAKLKR